jgi:hypothetical protein
MEEEVNPAFSYPLHVVCILQALRIPNNFWRGSRYVRYFKVKNMFSQIEYLPNILIKS